MDAASISHRRMRAPLVIEQIEDAIILRLKAALSGSVKVEPWPNEPVEYDFANLDAAALVHYVGSKYADRDGPARKDQRRTVEFAVVIYVRSLRGQGGAYDLVEDARLALQGSTFAGAGPALMLRDDMQAEAEGIWRWWVQIALPMPAVARDRVAPAALMRPITHVNTQGS